MPKSSTTSAVGKAHDKIHVVLDQQHADALAADFAQQPRQRLLFADAQAGRRLVEQQQHRIEAERARDLDQPQLAQRQRAGRLERDIGEADAVELTLRVGEQQRFLGAIEVEDRAQQPGAAAQMRAERDVLDHAHVGDDLDMLEGAAEAERRGALRRLRPQRVALELDLAGAQAGARR